MIWRGPENFRDGPGESGLSIASHFRRARGRPNAGSPQSPANPCGPTELCWRQRLLGLSDPVVGGQVERGSWMLKGRLHRLYTVSSRLVLLPSSCPKPKTGQFFLQAISPVFLRFPFSISHQQLSRFPPQGSTSTASAAVKCLLSPPTSLTRERALPQCSRPTQLLSILSSSPWRKLEGRTTTPSRSSSR